MEAVYWGTPGSYIPPFLYMQNNMIQLIPTSLARLKSLSTISFTGNRLVSVPHPILRMPTGSNKSLFTKNPFMTREVRGASARKCLCKEFL